MSKTRSRALQITYGEETIPVQVRFMDTERLTVTVDPDLTVRASAPVGATAGEVAERLAERGEWIARQRTYFRQFHPERAAQQFVTGASLWYLGKQYRLKTVEGRGPAKLVGQFLEVPSVDRETCERRVHEWYRERARTHFAQRLELCHAATKPILKVELPHLTVRHMIRRWGSCTAAGRITLNTDLIRAPHHCIDYVIIHELCHVRILGHDKAFYRLLAACLPDWESRKARLESFVV